MSQPGRCSGQSSEVVCIEKVPHESSYCELAFSELTTGAVWEDLVDNRFRCTECAESLSLTAETCHGNGGRWQPTNPDSVRKFLQQDGACTLSEFKFAATYRFQRFCEKTQVKLWGTVCELLLSRRPAPWGSIRRANPSGDRNFRFPQLATLATVANVESMCLGIAREGVCGIRQ